MTAEDAEILECRQEIEHCRTILAEGSSADVQLAVYEQATGEGSKDEALQKVVQWIADNTVALQ